MKNRDYDRAAYPWSSNRRGWRLLSVPRAGVRSRHLGRRGPAVEALWWKSVQPCLPWADGGAKENPAGRRSVVVFDTVCLLAKGQECVRDYNCGLKENGYVLSCYKFLRVCFRENRCNSVAVHDWIRALNEGNRGFHSVLEGGCMDFCDLYRKTTLNQDPIESKAISV